MHHMNIPPGARAVAETEFELLGALFSPAGRADPQAILRGSPLPGCQYPFVRKVLRDPRFAAPAIPPSADPAFQLLGRWMIRLEGDRHRRVRDAAVPVAVQPDHPPGEELECRVGGGRDGRRGEPR